MIILITKTCDQTRQRGHTLSTERLALPSLLHIYSLDLLLEYSIYITLSQGRIIFMVLDGVYYPVIHFCRVILQVWRSPFVVSLSLTYTLGGTYVLCVTYIPRCYATKNTFLI